MINLFNSVVLVASNNSYRVILASMYKARREIQSKSNKLIYVLYKYLLKEKYNVEGPILSSRVERILEKSRKQLFYSKRYKKPKRSI